jgi:GTP-binding protein Era
MVETNDSDENFRCGFVALVGRPNVGKSSLLNRLIGQKISIVSRKPQTTRHRLLGIHHRPDAQIAYVDTPGLHGKTPREINRYLNRTAADALADVDAVVFVVDGLHWTPDDELVLQRLQRVEAPVVLAVNKVDQIKDKTRLLPHLQALGSKRQFAEVIPVSAHKNTNLQALEDAAVRALPVSPPLFPEDQITDRSERFLAAELVREQLMRALGQELPYATTVEIEAFQEEGNLARIAAVIWVEQPGQKAIVIGQKGELLKRIGQGARIEMERLFDRKVFLQLWVKVREGWSDDLRALRSLGYE